MSRTGLGSSGLTGLLSTYIRWVVAHPVAVIASIAVITGLLLTQAASLKVEVNPDTQLPQEHPYIQALNRLNQVFGEKNLVIVGLFPVQQDIYTPEFLAKLRAVTDKGGALPGLVPRTFLSLSLPKAADIRAVPGGMAVTPFLDPLPRTREEALAVRERVRANPQYLGTIVAIDDSAAAIIADVDFTPALPGYPEVLSAVEKILAEEQDGSFTAHLSGPAVYIGWLARYSTRMFYFFPLAVLIIAFVHYEAFRTGQATILPLLTALLAMLWSLGLLGLLNVSLDPFNVTTPILILAVAAGHAVQMLKRFYEELIVTGDQKAAVQRSIEKVGPVMIIAACIAAMSFLSLLTFQTKAIRNFGLLTALGILSALTVELTIIPALRSVLPRPSSRELDRQASRHPFDRVVEALSRLVLAGPWWRAAAAATFVAAIFLVASLRVVVDSSFRRQFSSSATIRRDDRSLNAAFGGTSTLVLVIDGQKEGSIDEPALLRAVDNLQRWFEDEPSVGKTVSFVDFVKRMNAAANGDLPSMNRVPESRNLVAQYLLLYSLAGSVEDFDSMVDPTHRLCALRVYLKDDSTRFARELIERLRSRLDGFPPGYIVEITGSLASSDAINEVMVRGKLTNIIQIMAIILVISSFALKSILGGLLVASPLALAVVTNFGMMGLLGIPLDIGTATISAMAVGIGADYAVYFLFRLREELAKGESLENSIEATMRTSGKAILFVSSAIAAGYLTLCFSGFGYHVRLGTLVAFAMLVSSLASLTVLPSMVLGLRPAFLMESTKRFTIAPDKETVRRYTA